MKSATSYKASQLAKIGEKFSNPFPGLRPFGLDESHLFFGREGQSDEILLKLAHNRFTAILGFSGSGKSSLIYCGLVPILHGGFMTEAGADWRIVVMRPGVSPIDNLSEALIVGSEEYENMSTEEQVIRKAVLSTVMRSSSMGLIEAVKYLRTDRKENILIIVDQFEETFRYKKLENRASGLDDASLFVSLLVEAVRRQEEPIYVALTMRSDFIGECAAYPELTQMINDSHYLIPQMNREQKRMAIEGPVAVGGGKIAPRLVQQLLNDMGESPDQLPILQHALMRTWQFLQGKKGVNVIDVEHYNAIGTLKEALSQHANEAYDSLNKREQRICEVMFKSLTERGAENQMIRRPIKLGVMASIAGVSEADMIRVVDRFREPGRTLLMPPPEVPLAADTVVDISHESLIRIWTRLTTWVEEEARSAEMYLKLAEAAERYQKGSAGLWQMPDLQLALNWKEENKPTLLWGKRYHPAFERTMVFLATSRRAYENDQRNKELLQRRSVRLRNIVTIALACIAMVLTFLVYLSFIKADEAKRAARSAEESAAEATKASAVALQEKEKAETERAKAIEAQKEAVAAQAETKTALAVAERQKVVAEQQRVVAVRAQMQAEEAKEAASVNEKLAKEQAVIAKQEANRADKLRYQAIAQSMAGKVEDMRDPVQKSLTALQAYLYYEEYGDKLYNSDIYGGVYDAYKANVGAEKNQYIAHTGTVRALSFNKAGTVLFSAGSDGRVYKWNLEEDKKEATLLYDASGGGAILNVLLPFRSDSRLIVAGESNGIHILDALNGGLIRVLPYPAQVIYDMVLLPGDEEFVAVGSDGRLFRGSLSRSGTWALLDAGESRAKRITLSSDGKTLAVANEAGEVILYDLELNEKRLIYTFKGDPVHALRFNHAGTQLSFADETGELIIWDIEKRQIFTDLIAHYSRVNDIRFSLDDKLMLTSSWDGTAKMWDLEHINDLPVVLKDHDKWVWTSIFSPDAQRLVTAGADQIIRVYPTLAKSMISVFCDGVGRNMNDKEWARFVGKDIPYNRTCPDYPAGTNVQKR